MASSVASNRAYFDDRWVGLLLVLRDVADADNLYHKSRIGIAVSNCQFTFTSFPTNFKWCSGIFQFDPLHFSPCLLVLLGLTKIDTIPNRNCVVIWGARLSLKEWLPIILNKFLFCLFL